MIPVKLELHNFLAYRDPDPLSFEGIHVACISGENGAGKSSLLDAITWASVGQGALRLGRRSDLPKPARDAGGAGIRRWARRATGSSASAASKRRPALSLLELQVWDPAGGEWRGLSEADHARHAGPDRRPAPPGLRHLRQFRVPGAGPGGRIHRQTARSSARKSSPQSSGWTAGRCMKSARRKRSARARETIQRIEERLAEMERELARRTDMKRQLQEQREAASGAKSLAELEAAWADGGAAARGSAPNWNARRRTRPAASRRPNGN